MPSENLDSITELWASQEAPPAKIEYQGYKLSAEEFSSPGFRELRYTVEAESNGRLVIIIPGNDQASHSSVRRLRTLRNTADSDLRFNSISMSCKIEEDVDIEETTTKFEELIAQLHKNKGINQVVIVGYSFGGIAACKLASKLQKSQEQLDIAGVFLLSPVTSVESLQSAPLVRAFDSLPKTIQEKTLGAAYRTLDHVPASLAHSDAPKNLYKASLQMATVNRLSQIPDRLSSTDSLDAPVMVVIAQDDEFVNSGRLKEEAKRLAPASLSFIELPPEKMHKHNFDTNEWEDMAKTYMLPFIADSLA